MVDLATPEKAKEAPVIQTTTVVADHQVEIMEMIVAARMAAAVVDLKIDVDAVEEATEMIAAARMVVGTAEEEEEEADVLSRMDRRGPTVVGAASNQVAAVAVVTAMDVAILDTVAMPLESMNVGSMGT